MVVTQQFPNSFGRPETILRSPYTPGDGVLHVRDLPIGVALPDGTGAGFQVKVKSTLYYVTDLGPYPHIDWAVPAGAVELSDDAEHFAGTAVFLELTRAAMESLRAPDYITKTDQTGKGYPNSIPLDSLSIADLASALHADLTDVDPNQHHYQFHDHGSDADCTGLNPLQVFVQGIFAVAGAISPPQITSNQNDYQPVGGDEATKWYLNTDASRNITGIDGPQSEGVIRLFVNIGSFNIVFTHNDGASTIDHRFLLPGGVSYTLGPGHTVMAFYDSFYGAWRLVA